MMQMEYQPINLEKVPLFYLTLHGFTCWIDIPQTCLMRRKGRPKERSQSDMKSQHEKKIIIETGAISMKNLQ
ncbi:hypothetical protein H5410_000835 [Solanum commersonii]|uniref:Uncharacterized protein n=1 Tax=Solanum commersonii TaxID=4109 RepID=A0A9J6AX68_SOLCO|nr:hypothetical protein H5410_000835 [Solanum commersonii]